MLLTEERIGQWRVEVSDVQVGGTVTCSESGSVAYPLGYLKHIGGRTMSET